MNYLINLFISDYESEVWHNLEFSSHWQEISVNKLRYEMLAMYG